MSKYIFVTGGVVSGLGKGITAASLGRLLKSRGLKVIAQKIDPYINVDPSIMDPHQHGEIFITDDGAATDLDIGHYERFIDENLGGFSSLTAGKVYLSVIEKGRSGHYSGETVQVIPHITNEIKSFIYSASKNDETDVVITEIGGTVGDIESQPFLEAIRQVSVEVGKNNCLFIHVTLVPFLKSSGEQKSKPTQHSVRELQSSGIRPDIIVARCAEPLSPDIIGKISSFCNVKPDCVIENINVPVVYFTPLMLEKKCFSEIVCRELGLSAKPPELNEWIDMCARIKSLNRNIKIAIVGKYIQLHDAYLSVSEALKHAGYENSIGINIEWVSSDGITKSSAPDIFYGCAGVLITDGSCDEDIKGKIEASRFCRENNIPVLAVCLGMTATVTELVQNVLGIKNVDLYSLKSQNPYIKSNDANNTASKAKIAGSYTVRIKQDTLLYKAYGTEFVSERHRYRYSVYDRYRDILENNGMTVSAISEDGKLIEAVEYTKCDFCVGTLFLPELKSRPNRPSPIYTAFVCAALKYAENNKLITAEDSIT